ncbi:conserved hypothetical protein [uncultured spirochete]|uniref:Glycosyl transferase family 1 domain-containing protein n=1 Tax=uncultured spirochete TaxID=156406 RepID=A0A3P3XRM2_9SPIR|nr:conserved hypothetical protein [uncultured spirochete]
MRILWLCNVALPFISIDAKLPTVSVGGWLTGAYEGIKNCSDIVLGICFPVDISEPVKKGTVENITYYCFRRGNQRLTKYCSVYESIFRGIIADFQPDLVHIFGTEYSHSLAMTLAFSNPKRTIINIQGLVSITAQHFRADVPSRYFYGGSLRNVIKCDSLFEQRKQLEHRGQFEIAAIKNCGHIIGRTDWDRACTEQINPTATYHFCNETLRPVFYKNRWQYEKCEPFSIFVSQSATPIKGIHYLFRAMPEILRQYPKTKIYTTGRSPFKTPWYKRSNYEKYLMRLMEEGRFKDNVFYLGSLNEEQMCNQYLKSNVFVSSSTIENESNSLSEAKILGMPAIASFVGGVTNRLEHNIDGFLYQYNAHYMLAYYVCRVFSDRKYAENLGDNARIHAQKTHAIKENAEVLVKIYREVLA